MGKFAILLNLVICFVVFQKVSSKKVTICRGKEQSLVCQEGTGSLLINSAVLLRESRTECGDLSSWFIWCPKQAVSERVKEICNGNKHCTLMNDRSFLRSNQIEDECDSIDTRYLEIDYQCSGEPTIPPTTVPPEENNITMIPIAKKSQTICELDHGEIMCPGTTKINITSVFWGRRENEEICQSNYYTDKETSIKKCDFNNEEKKADLFQSMQKQCNNESKCQFFIPKWYLGNPCPESEVAKYLDINYDCMTDDFNQVCDQDTREITCYDNQVIQIGHAFYGHDPVKQNNCSVSQEKAQCGHDVTAQLNLICGGSRGCQVSALTDRFPATGCGVDVKPYVSFSYVCVNNTNKAAQPTKMTIPSPGPSAQVLTKNLSAGKGSFIGCFTEGTVIYVKSAWFGNKTLNCGKDVLKTVKYDCGGGTFCSLSADAGKYGRTDCSTSAELKLSMEYQCTPKPPGTIPPIPQPLVNTPTHSRNVPAVNINDAAQCGRQMRVRQRRVIQPAEAKAGRWPWQVEIYTSANNHICGGAMITNRWLLTAAHCIDKSNVATASEKYFVVLGEFNRSRNEGHEFKYNIQRVILHPGYDPQTLNAIQHDKDIALMQLDQNVELTSYIGTVCVPNTQNIDYWDNCVLTGWGKPTYPGSSAYVLQQGLLNVVTNQECQRKLKEDSVGEPGDEITSNMICGDDKTKSGVSGCQGDSGGPFVCRRKSDNKWYLRGLVSWGSQRCEIKEMYQVLTRVSSFYQWITNNI
ncbi:uncharacterized protein [Clytia hemisphaerica]|uniref:Uncharacterized protein n=1 Tax=Clytia hemisphaerica TaxID=252671 RepID=A0A7M5XHU8_9CNID